ncbi:hypothetical protein [Verrucomicrobium spinosum]|uniref:hypothetical protein n=1 Tax=Verrucomicrobium spinosum TaxID=2736 RepID=UPI0009464308|nr:hypothetical protein [Verrucomicrobium spinosum]
MPCSILGASCLGLCLPAAGLRAQTLTWDLTPGSPGVQNGSGTWNTTVANWIDSVSGNNVLWTNSGLEVAQFGSTTPVNPSVVTVSGNMNLKGLVFLRWAPRPRWRETSISSTEPQPTRC